MSQINVWLRSKEKIILVLICCVCMVAFVIGPQLTSLFTSGPLKGGRIFGKAVSGGKVLSLAKRLRLFMEPRRRTKADELIALAWETLIFQEEAERYGIQADDADVSKALGMRFRTRSGRFDEAAYHRYLRERGVTRSDYEDALRQLIAAEKVRAMVRNSVALPSEEAWLWYSREKENVKTEYVQLLARDLAPLAAADEPSLKAFYREQADTPRGRGPYGSGYLNPEKVKIEYIIAAYDPYAKKAEITDGQVTAYYESHKENYRNPDPAEDKKAETPAGKPAPTQDAAEGTSSEKTAPTYKPLAEVAKAVEKKLRREAAEREVERAMKEVNDTIWKALDVPFGSEEVRTVDLAAIAKDLHLDHRTTDFFSAEEAPKILPGARALAKEAFGQGLGSIGRVSRALAAGDGKFVFKLLDIRRAEPAPYEEAMQDVETHLRLKKGSELALEIAGNAIAAADLKAAATVVENALAELLKDAGEAAGKKEAKDLFHTGESNFFGRPLTFRGSRKFHFGAGLPGGVNSVNYAEAAFALRDGEVGMATDSSEARAVFLLQRTGVQPADRKAFDAEKDRVMQRLLYAKSEEVLSSWKRDLRRRAHPSEEVMKFLVLLPDWSG